MVLLMEKAKLVVEGAGAVGVAALLGRLTGVPASRCRHPGICGRRHRRADDHRRRPSRARQPPSPAALSRARRRLFRRPTRAPVRAAAHPLRQGDAGAGAHRRGNAAALLADHDLVIDGSDNFATRLAVSDACVGLGIALVSAAAVQFQGQVGLFRSKPCYRCFVGDAFDSDDCDNCAEPACWGAVRHGRELRRAARDQRDRRNRRRPGGPSASVRRRENELASNRAFPPTRAAAPAAQPRASDILAMS